MNIFLVLRIVRAIFGMAGVAYALVGCSTLNNASQVGGLEPGIERQAAVRRLATHTTSAPNCLDLPLRPEQPEWLAVLPLRPAVAKPRGA